MTNFEKSHKNLAQYIFIELTDPKESEGQVNNFFRDGFGQVNNFSQDGFAHLHIFSTPRV